MRMHGICVIRCDERFSAHGASGSERAIMSAIDLTMARSWFGTKSVIDLADYDANSNVIYVGYAPQGALSSDTKWIIYKLSYDGSNRYTGSVVSAFNSIWDNRTTIAYS